MKHNQSSGSQQRKMKKAREREIQAISQSIYLQRKMFKKIAFKVFYLLNLKSKFYQHHKRVYTKRKVKKRKVKKMSFQQYDEEEGGESRRLQLKNNCV